ncbi:MAG: pyridoxal-dependent decarboxylase [Bacilli bacterium]|nr:pyridoxal-dependent decarboxylase [Bacilli bacterium]
MKKKSKYEDYFLLSDEKQEKILKKTINISLDFLRGDLRDNKFLIYKKPEYLKSQLDSGLPLHLKKIENTFKILKKIGRYSIAQSDLNYLAFPDSGNSLIAMMGALYSKFLNQNLIGFDRSAPVATFIEIQLIEWLRELIGYNTKSLKKINCLADVGGMFTTGGHMSNHVGILAALNKKFPEIKENGLSNLKFSPVILLSKKISHYSIDSAAHHLGIGKENIIDIPITGDYTTDYNVIEKILKKLPKNKKPFMVVSVAGNTRTSNIDNLSKINNLCKKHNLWHHIDACHGGSLLFSDKLKSKYLQNIEQADSVTIDPHKGLFVPYSSSYILFKERSVLTMFSRYQEDCFNGSVWDLGFITPFYGSRGFDSLSLWLFIKIMGKKSIGEIIESRFKIVKFAEKIMKENQDFITLNEIDIYRMAFVFCPDYIQKYITLNSGKINKNIVKKLKSLIDKYSHIINQRLYESGKLCLDEYKLHDAGNKVGLGTEDRYIVFAITLGNPLFTKETIEKSLNILFQEAEKIKIKMYYEFNNIISFKTNVDEKKEYKSGPAGW